MDKKNSLRAELLNHMDKNQGDSPDRGKNSVQAILAKDAARLRRLKRTTVMSWVLFAASFLATGMIGLITGFREEVWLIVTIIGVQALLIFAVACTFILSIRSRTLRMKQIQATLADIQERLNKLAEDR